MSIRGFVTATICGLAVCLAFANGPRASRAAEEDGHATNWWFRSCTSCGSIQRIQTLPEAFHSTAIPPRTTGEWQWQYRNKGADACDHRWMQGYPNSVPTKIADEQVVLVRKGDRYGAFMLHGQRSHPDSATYTWCYGTDEAGTFNLANQMTSHSTAPEMWQSRVGDITFGPFAVQWSADSEGLGYIYYSALRGDILGTNALAICVTATNSFAGISPGDARWKYRRHRFDEN